MSCDKGEAEVDRETEDEMDEVTVGRYLNRQKAWSEIQVLLSFGFFLVF